MNTVSDILITGMATISIVLAQVVVGIWCDSESSKFAYHVGIFMGIMTVALYSLIFG